MLDKAELVEKELCQGKNEYKSGGIFHASFLAPKLKCYLSIGKYGIIHEHKTFKGFEDTERLSDRSQYSNMKDDKKYQLCYQNHRKNLFIMESSCQQN